MISLYDYIKKDWTVGGRKSSKLLIFDLDDTIIHTTANINVLKDGKIVKTLTNTEYNTYERKPGEYFDYSEFADPTILNHERFTKYWKTLKREYMRGTHISIITARPDDTMIRKFFLRHGIDIKPELIFAVGSPNFLYSGSTAQKKAKVIELLSGLGYDTMIFFDDSEENLKAAKALTKSNLKIHTVKV